MRPEYFEDLPQKVGMKTDTRGPYGNYRQARKFSKMDPFEEDEEMAPYAVYQDMKPHKRQKHHHVGTNSQAFQSFMKEMLYEFFNQQQEALHSPRRYSPRGLDYQQMNYGLGLRDQARFSSDNYQTNIRNHQFRNWFENQMKGVMNQYKSKNYLTYGQDRAN